jgi:hypothetical protein
LRIRLPAYRGRLGIRPLLKAHSLIWFAVAIGLEILALPYSEKIDELTNLELADSRKQTVKSLKFATEANERSKGFDAAIATSNAEAKKATDRATQAEALAKRYEAQISESNAMAKGAEERAAEANLIAETERLARVRIEERLSGWKLDARAQANVIAQLKAYPGTPFDLFANPDEASFLNVIDSMLRTSGWKREPPMLADGQVTILLSNKAAIMYVPGFIVEVASEKEIDFGKAFVALVGALIAHGIPVQPRIAKGAPQNAIHIVIGKRE